MNRLFLYPSTEPIRTSQQRRTILLSDSVLEIWRAIPSEAPRAFVLEFVGNASRAEHGSFFSGKAFTANHIESWMVNYPGYGGSTGNATLRNNVIAAEAAYQELKKIADGRPIFFAGNSIGTTAALYLAARYPSAGVLLKNPPPLQRLVLGRFGWWNAWLLAGPVALWIPSELNSIKNAAQSKSPAIFITAEDDNVVPPRFQRMIINAYAGPKTALSMPKYGHNDGLTQEAESAIEQFLKSHLP